MKKTVRFDSIANSITERVDDPSVAGVSKYVGLEHLDPESIEISRWGAPEEVSATKLRFYIGDVIYGRRRAYQKKLGVARFEGICSAHALVLRAREEECLPRFLPYFLLSDQFHNRALEISVGSLSPTINWSTLRQQQFELPSLEEQAHIVQLLSAVDEHAEALRLQLNVAQETRKSVLHELLSSGGDDWTKTTLGEVSIISYGYTDSASNEIVGPRFLRITDIQDSGVDWELVPYCRIDEKQLQQQRLQDGDIVFARTGATTGKSFLVLNPPNAVCASYLIRLRADSGKVTPGFLNLNFQTDLYWGQVKSGTTGSAQGGFNATKLASLSLPLPTLDEQKRIVEEISRIDSLINETKTALTATRELRSSLLNKEIS